MSKPENSVDHVLDRMVEAMLGEDVHFKSHALALNIPRETIKTWKRRGEVPLGTLKNFALDWKVPLDWLLHGDRPEAAQAEAYQVNEPQRPYGLSADEAALLETYRQIGPEVCVTLQNLLKVIAGAGRVASAPLKTEPPKAEPRRKLQPQFGVGAQPGRVSFQAGQEGKLFTSGKTQPAAKKTRKEES